MTYLTCVIPLLVLCLQANAGVLINEVMSNEPGRETSLEWVELWNFSDTSVSLEGLVIIDGDLSSPLSDLDELSAFEFVVLVSDEARFEGFWGDSSGVWGDAPTEDFRIMPAEMSLRNSADTVELYDMENSLLSRCAWSVTAPDGVSFERFDPRHDDNSAVWSYSVAESGTTPGRMNSISPGFNDLELVAAFAAVGEQRDWLRVDILVRNIGLVASDSNRLTVGIDYDGDGDISSEEQVGGGIIEPLDVYDSVQISVQEAVALGRFDVVASLLPDDVPQNNVALATLRFGIGASEIVINEILPDPEIPLETEWVELLNISDEEIALTGWSICDASGCADLDSLVISSGEYMILCHDKPAFDAFYPDVNVRVVSTGTWRSLNNDGDTLFIVDETGAMVDSMLYSDVFGSNVSSERIDPFSAGFDLSNWYRSTAPEGSTPGRPNSVVEGFAEQSSVWLESKLISPDGDGRDDLLVIKYDLAKGAALTLKVFDLGGQLMKTILDRAFLTSGEFEYDATLEDGSKLEVGLYVILAEISGKVETRRKLVLAVVGE
ncbi:MAG: lamin tail domain-containing protein [Candidatus Zixiibacteriota bacterium]